MAAAIGNSERQRQERKQRQPRQEESPVQEIKQDVQQEAQKAEKRFAPLIAFWTKINNDGIFNWSATLAYTFLISLFPIFLVILAIGGFILGAISPQHLTQLQNALASGFPGGANGTGGEIVKAVLHQMSRSAGVFLILGILGAIIGGSGLFLTLESAFDIIFRLKSRDPIPQRIMAVSMVLLYVVLVPIMVFASILPGAILGALHIGTNNPGGAFLIQVLGLIVGFVSAVLFFGAIYFIVPNCRMSIRDIWKGTLLVAGLLVLYELVFPIYEGLFLHPNNYGSLVGFVIVILTFLYYMAFIVLLGAEVNSMAMGLRPTTKPINAILQELQARDLMIESAAEVSGKELPQEDRSPDRARDSERQAPVAAATATPREPALVAPVVASPIPVTAMPRTRPAETTKPTKPLTKRQRTALGAVVVAGAIAVAPIVRFAKRLMLGEDEQGERRLASD